jgi:hypothetical protein
MLDAITGHHSSERQCGHHSDRLGSRHRVNGNSTSNAMMTVNLFGKQVNIKTNNFIDEDLYRTNSCPTLNR